MNKDNIRDRSRYSRVFALADAGVLATLAATVAASAKQVEILQAPATSLVMMATSDPVSGASFYAGEVLVTSCQVLVDGRVGCSVALGDEESRVKAAALLDAALQNPTMDRSLLEQVWEEEQRIERLHRAESALAERTRVQFETMEDQDAGNDLRPRI